ncbi:MAG: hypothetical protein ACK47B_19795 [Armatimonadota bacterium]
MAETGTLPSPAAEEAQPAAEAEEAAPRRSLRERWDDWRDEWRRVDWEIVRTLLVREALITVRSAAWMRLLAGFAALTVLLALLPGLHRSAPGHWTDPVSKAWLVYWAVGTAAALVAAVYHWTSRRVGRELRSGALDEILLTGTGPADILLAKALSAAGIAATLALTALPASLLMVAVAGQDGWALLRLWLTLGTFAYLGLYLGLESTLRGEGSASATYLAWVVFQTSAVCAAIGKMVGWSWLAFPRRAMNTFNPISTLLAAAGTRPERWPIGFIVCVVLLVVLTLIAFRLLRRDWAHAAHRAQKEGLWGKLQRSPRKWRLNVSDALAPMVKVEPLRFGNRPVAELERELGSRIGILSIPWLLMGMLSLVFILASVKWNHLAPITFQVLLGVAAVATAHDAATSMAADRESGRWRDLVMLPAANWQLLRDKLQASWESAWVPSVGAVLELLIIARIDSWEIATGSWMVVTLLLLPLSACLIGALIGVRSASVGQAQARSAVLFAGLPVALWFAQGSLGAAGWLVVLNPLAAWSAGSLTLAWASTLLYAASGVTAMLLLNRKLRDWVAG